MDVHPANTWEGGPTVLESLWRHRLVVLMATMFCGITGFTLAMLQGPRYEATAQLLLANPEAAGVFRQELGRQNIDMRQYRDSQVAVMTSRLVREQAATILGQGMTAADIKQHVKVKPIGDSNAVTIQATDVTAERAAAIANGVVEAYQQRAAEAVQTRAKLAVQELQRISTTLRDRIGQLAQVEQGAATQRLAVIEGKIDQVRVDAVAFGSGVEFLDPATAPTAPSARPVRYGLAGAILGLLSATAFAYWRGGRDVNVLDRDVPTAVIGAPLLGEIPEFGQARAHAPVPTITDQASAAAEAYQFVVASLRLALKQHGGHTVLITSPVPGDGKTITALNVAIAAGRDGREVLLVDGDQRQRELSRICWLVDRPGLTDIALGQSSVDDAVAECWLAGCPAPRAVAAGSAVGDVASFLRTSSFRAAMDQLKERADLVVIDSPPILTAADALSIAAQADGVVLIVRNGTPMSVLQDVRRQLDLTGCPLLGYVFNRADTKRSRYRSNRSETIARVFRLAAKQPLDTLPTDQLEAHPPFTETATTRGATDD
jgi:capsular exopolysaccharide synthesis family protein